MIERDNIHPVQNKDENKSSVVGKIANSKYTLLSTNAPSKAGKAHGHWGSMADIITKAFRRIYRRERYYVLSFDLTSRTIPSPKPADAVTIRLLTPNDISCFLELWHDKQAWKAERFKERMEKGYIGIGAWSGDKLIGVNWLAPNEDYDSFLNLLIKMSPGACLALDLQENEEFKRHRIGLATLAYSLKEAGRRGFKLQFIVVSDKNTKMLAGAKFLMGYKQVGEITTTHWFTWAHSRWHFGGRTNRGKMMALGADILVKDDRRDNVIKMD